MADTIIDKVQVQINATTQGTAQAFKTLDTQLRRLQDALNAVDTSKLQAAQQASKSISIDSRGFTKEEKEVQKALDRIKQSFASMKAYKDAALGGDSSSLTSFSRKAIHLESDIAALEERLRQVDDMMKDGNINTAMFQTYREQLAELVSKFTSAKDEVSDAVQAMNENQITLDTEESKSNLDILKEKARSAANTIASTIGRGALNAFKNLASNIKKAASHMKDLGHSTNGATGNFKRGFMTVLKYGFGIRSLYVLFRRLRKAVVESFGELQKSGAFYETTRANVEALKASLSTLKYQFGAAFEPIFNAIAPALQTLINYLITAANAISAFMAKLTGKSTYSKAVASANDLADATGGAAKAQKELNKQLQGFDELNNLSSNNPSGGGGGGGASGDSNAVTYVEEAVDNALGDFGKKLADSIKNGDWKGVGTLISTKLTEMMEQIPWNTIYAKASNFGTNLANFLKGLITPELFETLGATIANSLKTALIALKGFADTLNEIDPETGLSGWQQFGQSLAAGIKGFIEQNPLELAVDTFNSLATGILDGVLKAITDLLSTQNGKSTMQKIAQQIANGIGNVQAKEIGFKVGEIVNGLANAVYVLISDKATWANLGQKIADGINGVFSGMLEVNPDTGLSGWEALGKDITSTISGIVSALTTALKGVRWEDVGQSIADFIKGMDLKQVAWDLAGMASAIISALGGAIEGFKNNLTEKQKIIAGVSAFLGSIAITGSIPLSLTIAAAIVGIKIGTKIYEVSTGNTVDQSFLEEVGDILDGMFVNKPVSFSLDGAISFVWDELTGADSEEAAEIRSNLKKAILAAVNPLFATPFIIVDLKKAFKLDNLNSFMDIMNKWWNGDDTSELTTQGMPSDVVEKINANADKGMKQKLEDLGKQIAEGIKTGFDVAVKAINFWTDPVGTLKSKLIAKICELFGIESPAKAMYIYGQNIAEGILKGFLAFINLTSGELSIPTVVDTMKTNLVNWITSKFTGWSVGEIIKKVANTAFDITANAPKWDDLKDAVGKLQDKIKKGLKTTIQTKLKAPKTDNKKSVAKKIKKFISGDDSNAEFSKTVKLKIDVSSSINSLKDYVNDYIIAPLNKTLTELGKKAKIIITPIDRLAKGGALYGGSWHSIPQFANGTTDALKYGSIFAAGENGPEVVGHINGRTEILNRSQLASTMHSAIINGMRQFKNAQMVQPPTVAYANGITGANAISSQTANNDLLMAEQNQLIAEQNRLLQIIANKNVTISSRDVFNATRQEAQNYNNRTGNSPFLF